MRTAVMLVAVAAGAFALAGCGGDNGSQATTTTDTSTVETTTTATDTTATETTATETTPATPKPTTIVIVVDNGRPNGGIKRPTLQKGDKVVLVIRTDAGEEVHLHGYDIEKPVTPGTPVRIPFTANLPGRFELELHHPGRAARRPGGAALSRPDVVAHGIGGVQDLPVPAWMFYWGAAVVLVVSFVLLGVLWRKPLLGALERGRSGAGQLLSRLVLGPLRVVAQVALGGALLPGLGLGAVRRHGSVPQPCPDMDLRDLLAGPPGADRRLRLRVARAVTVARDGRRVRLGAGARRRRSPAARDVSRAAGPLARQR